MTFTSIKNINVDVNKDIDSKYNFKEFQYASIIVSLSEKNAFISICADIEAKLTLIYIMFFKAVAKNVQIKVMTTSITIRDVDIDKHATNKYAIVSMYFLKKKRK